MTPDETLLSAYLDDELDADARRRVDAALAAEPALAEVLRRLAQARDLVAGLPRPAAGPDVAASTVARIASRRARQERTRLLRSWAVVGGLAAAAVLLMVDTLVLRRLPDRPRKRDSAEIVVIRRPSTEGPGETATAEVATEGQVAAPAPPEPVVASDDAAERAEIRDALEREDVERIVVVARDAPVVRGRLDALVRDSARVDPVYRRVVVPEGEVVDPARPKRADVYVLSMSDGELEEFQARLTRELRREADVQRVAPPPLGLARLAEVGRIEVFQGTRAATVRRPNGDPSLALLRPVPDGPTPEQLNSAPRYRVEGVPEANAVPDAREVSPPGAEPRRVVLIWLTTP